VVTATKNSNGTCRGLAAKNEAVAAAAKSVFRALPSRGHPAPGYRAPRYRHTIECGNSWLPPLCQGEVNGSFG